MCYLIAQCIVKTGNSSHFFGKWQQKLVAWSICPWTTELQIELIITRRQLRPSFDHSLQYLSWDTIQEMGFWYLLLLLFNLQIDFAKSQCKWLFDFGILHSRYTVIYFLNFLLFSCSVENVRKLKFIFVKFCAII